MDLNTLNIEASNEQTLHERIRYYWVDVLRAVTIVLVVFGHVDDHAVTRYLGAVRMPMFFFLSGMLLSRKALALSAADFAKKYFISLIVPYFVFGLATYLIWYGKNLYMPGPTFSRFGPIHSLLGMVYGISGPQEWLGHNVPIWFLTCLFVVHHLFYGLHRLLNHPLHKLAASLVVGAAGYLLIQALPFRLPWNVEIAMIVLPFYAMGHVTKAYGLGNAFASARMAMRALPVAFALFVIAIVFDDRIDLNMGLVGIAPLFYVGGLGGIVVFSIFAMHAPRTKLVTVIGKNTLVILCMHELALGIYRVGGKALLGEAFLPLTQSIAYSVSATVFAVAFCLVVTVPLRTLMAWAKGRSRQVTSASP